jgi:hypothetical protein
MIIVKLQGGLGNQMFQYALGRRLALLHKSDLKLDLHFLNDKTPKAHFTMRDYELGAFNLVCDFSGYDEVKHFYGNKVISKFKRKFGNIKYCNENGQRFQPKVFDLKEDIYLDGYWQSEKYFASIRSNLLSEFSLKESILDKLEINASLKQIKELINTTNSVSVHFRRGDYVSDTVTSQFHGTCSMQYYEEAIKLIASKIQNPYFFLFTDDLDWVMNQKIIEGFPTTLAFTSDMYLDMHLMSLCKNNIIANSSFSWWGAWLNQNEEKLVIAPKRWFAKEELNPQTQDLIPQKWIRL